MPHTHKPKKAKVQEPAAKVTREREPTNAKLRAINKGEGYEER